MRILGVLFLASASALLGGGVGPDINTLSSCDNVSVLSDLTNSTGCAVDPFSIFNVSFTPPGGSPTTTAGDISFDISYGGGNLGVSFGGNFLLPAGVSNPPGYAEYVIEYVIDPPPPVILGFEMDAEWSDGSNFRIAGPESFLVQALTPIFEVYTDLCVGGNFDPDARNRCTNTSYGPLFLDPNQLFDSVFFINPTNWVNVRHRIRVYQDVNLFVNNNAPLREGSEVPEPGTWVLMGMGVALVLLGRRRR